MGPDRVGGDFDNVDEDEPQDPDTIYDVLDVSDGALTITSQLSDVLSIQPDGDDLVIDIKISDDPEGDAATEYQMVVPQTAFLEALRDIGVTVDRD